MIYVSKNKSIIKIVGTKKECLSDFYNISKGCIRSGILSSELAKTILAAALAVTEEMEDTGNEHTSN